MKNDLIVPLVTLRPRKKGNARCVADCCHIVASRQRLLFFEGDPAALPPPTLLLLPPTSPSPKTPSISSIGGSTGAAALRLSPTSQARVISCRACAGSSALTTASKSCFTPVTLRRGDKVMRSRRQSGVNREIAKVSMVCMMVYVKAASKRPGWAQHRKTLSRD